MNERLNQLSGPGEFSSGVTPRAPVQLHNGGKPMSEMLTADRLLRKKDVAARLACSVRTIDREASSGHLTRVPFRGTIRFRESEILRIINGGSQ